SWHHGDANTSVMSAQCDATVFTGGVRSPQERAIAQVSNLATGGAIDPAARVTLHFHLDRPLRRAGTETGLALPRPVRPAHGSARNSLTTAANCGAMTAVWWLPGTRAKRAAGSRAANSSPCRASSAPTTTSVV